MSTIRITYKDGRAVEHEIDYSSTVTVTGPSRAADGSIRHGDYGQTFSLEDAAKVEFVGALKPRLHPSGQNPRQV